MRQPLSVPNLILTFFVIILGYFPEENNVFHLLSCVIKFQDQRIDVISKFKLKRCDDFAETLLTTLKRNSMYILSTI